MVVPGSGAVTAPSARSRRAARTAAALAVALLAVLPLSRPASAAASGGLEPLLDQLTAHQHAAYAVLVDTSASMDRGGYYSTVRDVLPGFLTSLRPQDQVCVITFAEDAGDCHLVSPADAQAELPLLPARADGGASDFGLAFARALDSLRQADASAAGVLLLSDAELNAPHDPDYTTYDSPGWAELRQEAAKLPDARNVTGYGFPFGDGSDIATALEKVLPRHKILDPSDSDLGTVFGQALDDSRIHQAEQAVAADAGKGVAFSWPDGPPPSGLTSGSVVRLRLTATTGALPVRLSGARLHGLPDGVRLVGGLPGTVELGAGAFRDFRLQFAADAHRKALLPGDGATTWRMSVGGRVDSPLAGEVRSRLGGERAELAGSPSGSPLTLSSSVRTSANLLWWAVIAAVVVSLVYLGLRARARTRRPAIGHLYAETVDSEEPLEIPLHGKARFTVDLSEVVEGGTLVVRTLPGPPGVHPPLRLHCQLPDRPAHETDCPPGRTVLLCGIEFRYEV